MAKIAPLGRYRAFDANGDPLAGGKLYTYEAGTNTPKSTFTDKDGNTANANPVVMDSEGYADVWLGTGGYKFVLDDANDVNQLTVDDIDGGVDGGFASTVISKSSSFALTTLEQGNVIICTSALTVSLLAAAVAGNGFAAVIVNTSSGNVTIDPDGSETVNGASSLVIGSGNSAVLSTDGTLWVTYGSSVAFSDDLFRVFDNADNTKKLAFSVGGITTGTTRTLTVTDTSLSIPANATAASSLILAEDTDNGSNTIQIIAPSAVTSNRVLILPDEDGTVVTTTRVSSDTVAGIIELATTAETQTGTDTGRAVSPASVKGAIGFSKVFSSTGYNCTRGSKHTIAHGFGAVPSFMTMQFRCTSAENGYAVGDVIQVGSNSTTSANAASVIFADATNIYVVNNASAGTMNSIRGDNGGAATFDVTKWVVDVKAWA